MTTIRKRNKGIISILNGFLGITLSLLSSFTLTQSE